MSDSVRSLPDFEDPPVFETVLGVQFGPISELSILHFGLYWKLIRSEYPRSDIKPPLSPMAEQFGAEWKPPSFGLQFASVPELRCWFIDSSETRVIQVQNDRFIHNWRKVRGDETYPRYESVKLTFAKEWQRFCEFLKSEGATQPEVNQCEVTYINHIEVGKGWESYGRLNDVIAYWSGKPSGNFLSNPESVGVAARYRMPDDKGRLHVEMQPAIRRSDAKEVLQLNLTARGKPPSSRLDDILEWLDFGREWIVRGFTDFTSDKMHRAWRRKA